MGDEMVTQKSYAPFELKAVDEEARTFSGLASTWELDLDGDVIDAKAFDRTLAHWKSTKGRIIPLIDAHNYRSVRSVFGKLEEAQPNAEGLATTFSIVKSDDGDEYLSRIKDGYLNALSIGYETLDSAPEDREIAGKKVKVRRLKEVRLMECSAVIWGANPSALIDTASVKAMLHEAGLKELTEEERAEFKALHEKIGSLIEPPRIGMSPDDPARLETEDRLRRLRLAMLA